MVSGGREHGRRWRVSFGTPRAQRAAPPRRRRFLPRTRARGARLACAVLSRKSAVVRAPKCACMHGARALAVVPRAGVRHSCGLVPARERRTPHYCGVACAQEHVRVLGLVLSVGHLRTSVVMLARAPGQLSLLARSPGTRACRDVPARSRARPTNRPTCRRPTRPAPAPARPPARLPALSPHTRGRAHRKRAGTRTENARARVQHTREGGCTLPVALESASTRRTTLVFEKIMNYASFRGPPAPQRLLRPIHEQVICVRGRVPPLCNESDAIEATRGSFLPTWNQKRARPN